MYEPVGPVAPSPPYKPLPKPERNTACLRPVGRRFCFLRVGHRGPCRPGISR